VNRIAEKFKLLRSQNTKAFIPYITPEFPVPGTTVPLIIELEKAGATMIEIGIPFSDPLADGPTIQHSSEVAIRNGATIHRVFECVKEARKATAVPLILMGYFNPILQYGTEKFLQDAKECGVDGLIVPDLLPEESAEFRLLSQQYGLSNIFLVAPTSSDERIRSLGGLSTDFVYCVSVTGVTGSRNSFGDHFTEFLNRVKLHSGKPFVVGFGISTKEQVSRISSVADGVVVGSALLQAIGDKQTVGETVRSAHAFISTLL